jgi:hypothetical protein
MQSMFKLFLILLMLMCLPTLTSSIDKLTKNINLNNINNINKPKKINKNKTNKNIKTFQTTQSIQDVCGGNKIFYKLDDALTILPKLKGTPVLVAFDVHEDGAKNWCFFNERIELLNFIKSNPCCSLYEQINPAQHKLYFDIDLEEGEVGFDTFVFKNYKLQLEKELNNILNNKLSFVWLNSSNHAKHSYHLVVPVSCSNSQNNQIKNYLNEKLGTYYLDDVYSEKRCFRFWGCSKLGQKRSLKIIGKHSFNDTLVNLYGENVKQINSKIELKDETKKVKSNVNSNDWIPVPENKYLNDNFEPSKYQKNVYVRIHRGSTLPCPICISKKQVCKEKHHKTSSVYVFKKGVNVYMGCFRAKQWGRDRYFLNLSNDKVEYLPKSKDWIIEPLKSAIKNFKKSLYHDDMNTEIKEILNLSINFGKYKNQSFKELFSDISYVNWILTNFKDSELKQYLNRLINYYNEEYVEWDYEHFRPKKQKVPTSSTRWVKHPDSGWVEQLTNEQVKVMLGYDPFDDDPNEF